MKLVGFVPPTPHPLWTLCPQMGVTGVVVKIHPDLTGLPAPALAGLALAARRTAKAASERLFSATTLHLLLSVFCRRARAPFSTAVPDDAFPSTAEEPRGLLCD